VRKALSTFLGNTINNEQKQKLKQNKNKQLLCLQRETAEVS